MSGDRWVVDMVMNMAIDMVVGMVMDMVDRIPRIV